MTEYKANRPEHDEKLLTQCNGDKLMAFEQWDIRKIEGEVKRKIHSRAVLKGIDIGEEMLTYWKVQKSWNVLKN